MTSTRGWRLAAGALVVALCAVTGRPSVAEAGDLDLKFHKFYDPDREVTQRTENKAYTQLMREVSLAMGPKMAGPAASLGSLGIEAAYGLQIGSVLTHMFDSNMWSIGAELNMSFIDGFVNIPDVAARISANTVLGNADLGMLIVGTDFIISKAFGIGGIVSLQPWAGYSMTFTHVNTHQIDVYPGDKEIKPDLMLLKSVSEFAHRGVFGFRVVVTRVSLGFEFLRSFTDDLSVMTGKLGVDF